MRKFLSFIALSQLFALTAFAGPEDKKFEKLLATHWEYLMREYPEWATMVGYPGQNGRWSDRSPEAIAARKVEARKYLSSLERIKRKNLTTQNQLNYDLFGYSLQTEVRAHQFPAEYLAIDQLEGPQIDIPQLLSQSPARNLNDYKDFLSRLKGIPKLLDQAEYLLNEGVKAGVTPAKVTLTDVPDQIKGLLTTKAIESPILEVFKSFPSTISSDQQNALRSEAEETFEQRIRPALTRFHQFVSEKYLPGARTTIAWRDLPNGQAWYAHRIRHYTTTDLSADEIHQIGLKEVARIRGEMEKIIRSVGFTNTFTEFLNFLRTDPQFFYTTADDLLRGYRDICKRADPELVKLFGRLPQTPYGVKAIATHAEKASPTAYYFPGSSETARPGYFMANTYDLKSRPKWEMEALTLHEAVPGHHFQISIAQELKNVPEFRKHSSYAAYVEGWGLYAESLGTEMGFYQDPYSKFGQLTYEMWRAIRLVVDTGIHAKGWSRDQAVKFFRENAGKPDHDINVEVDRYINWAGQALAYKIGELKIKELRKKASAGMGDKFDIRKFHDEILSSGAVPLPVLEAEIDRWIMAQK